MLECFWLVLEKPAYDMCLAQMPLLPGKWPMQLDNQSWEATHTQNGRNFPEWIFSCLFFREIHQKIHRRNQTPKSTRNFREGVSLTEWFCEVWTFSTTTRVSSQPFWHLQCSRSIIHGLYCRECSLSGWQPSSHLCCQPFLNLLGAVDGRVLCWRTHCCHGRLNVSFHFLLQQDVGRGFFFVWKYKMLSESAWIPNIRNTLTTVGNCMTSSERPSPEPLLKKELRPQPYSGGENFGNALEASNALKYRVWGFLEVLLRGIPGKPLRAFSGFFRNLSGMSSTKSQPYWVNSPERGFCTEILTRHVDFALKFALATSILTALSKAINSTGKVPSRKRSRRLDRESAVQTVQWAEKCDFEMSWFNIWCLRAPPPMAWPQTPNEISRKACSECLSIDSPAFCQSILSVSLAKTCKVLRVYTQECRGLYQMCLLWSAIWVEQRCLSDVVDDVRWVPTFMALSFVFCSLPLLFCFHDGYEDDLVSSLFCLFPLRGGVLGTFWKPAPEDPSSL